MVASMTARDRYQIAVRHGEKTTLLWWQRLFARGIQAAQNKEYSLKEYWEPRSIPGVWRGRPRAEESHPFSALFKSVIKQIVNEAEHPAENPVEFFLLLGLVFFGAEGACCLLQPLWGLHFYLKCCFTPALMKRVRLRACQLYLLLGLAACMNEADMFGKREDRRPMVLKLQTVLEHASGCLTVGMLIMHVVLKLLRVHWQDAPHEHQD